jgi:alpha-L-rhamnosidase
MRIALVWQHFLGAFCGSALLFISIVAFRTTPVTAEQLHAPTYLRCEALETPLGLDTPAPRFSWQLDDGRQGGKQTAYEIQVATRPELIASGKADVWNSGRVQSDQSVAVPYRGSELRPEQRYYWRVKVWDKDGVAYPASAVTWWETGLMRESWQAKWIGYELPEHRAIRESRAAWITNPKQENFSTPGNTHHDFRLSFTLDQPVKAADLYVTGKDTAAAWVNGKQVLAAEPLPPYKQTPWKKYVVRDVTNDIQAGRNVLAIEVTLYDIGEGGHENHSQTPMSACLYIEKQDGTVEVVTSGTKWKAELNATGEWRSSQFDDASWPAAVPADVEGRPWPTGPVKMLRREFHARSGIRSARLYASALGAYRFWINGKRIGDQILAPGWTDYRERVAYQTYDVTKAVTDGNNAIGAYLAPGWYTTPLQWTQEPYNYGNTPPALRAQLRIEYNDGSIEWMNTDESWKADVSPIEKAEIYDGESYDARREQPGWNTAQFSDAAWKSAQVVQPKEPEIVAEDYPPIRVEMVLHAKSVTEPKPSVYVLDFGQDMAAVPVLRMQGPVGTKIRLRFAEVLNPDGTIYTENLRTALATDEYTFSGKGVEEYEPEFTFHGFRYVEITGLPSRPAADIVTARVIHTAAPITAKLETGSAMLNQLWSNILWGQRSNFVGVPTDCPQRDERLGWTGDAEVFWRAASYNMDLTPFSKKYAADLRGTQVGTPMYGIYAPGTSTPNSGHAAGWSDAGVIVSWTSWLQSGDTGIIEQNWEAMTKYLAAIEQSNPDYLWRNAGIPFGDWLSPEAQTKPLLIQTAYWAYDVTLMREMAHATGRTEDEQKYAALFAKIKDAFAKQFVQPDGLIPGADNGPSQFGRIFEPGRSRSPDTQTGYVLALYMHLVPDALGAKAAERLVEKIKANNWRLGTGFLGTPYLLAVLADTGHQDVAYRLLLNTAYPSWGYLVEHGATTMWERWNGDQMRGDPSMNSYNHYAYGAVADWIYRYAAGVDARATDAGFHTIYLHPNFDSQLGSLSFAYASPYGEIRSAWKMSGGETNWSVTVPANARAELPLNETAAAAWLLDGQPIAKSGRVHEKASTDGEITYELAAGTYSFTVPQGR